MLPTGARVDAVVERDLQHLGHVEVAGQAVVLLAERARFDTAAGAAVARILDTLAGADHLLHDHVGVEDGGLAEAGADDLGRALDEAIRVLLAQLHRRTGLEQPHLLDDVEQQIGDVVDRVGAVGLDAAGVDLGEIGVGAALGRGDADLGRGRLVVELDPEAVQQFLGLLTGQRAVSQTRPGRRDSDADPAAPD